MNILLAMTQFHLMTFILLREVERKSPASYLWATLYIMFGVTHLTDVLFSISEYKNITMMAASVFVISFCAVYELIRVIINKKLFGRLRNQFGSIEKNIREEKRKCDLIYYIWAASCFMIIWDLSHLSGGILQTSWGGARAISESKSYFNGSQILMLFYNAFGGLLCVSIIRKEKIRGIICFFILVAVELITRNRVLILPLLISILSVVIFKLKKIKFSTLLFGVVSGIFVILLIYSIRAFRWMGTLEESISRFSINDLWEQVKVFLVTSDGELGLRNWFYYYIENDNQFVNFGRGHTYIRMMLVYIPSKLSMGIKPPDFAISMGAAIGMSEGESMHPTLFGDCYANLGIMGIFLGIYWGLMVCALDRVLLSLKLNEFKILAFILISCAFVIIGRGAVYNGFFNIAWGTLVLVIWSSVSLKVPRIRIKLRS